MDNKKIIDLLKLILEKVERLEKIKTDNVTIGSGTFTINCGDASAVGIDTAESVIIQGATVPVSVEHADEFSVHSAGGEITVKNN